MRKLIILVFVLGFNSSGDLQAQQWKDLGGAIIAGAIDKKKEEEEAKEAEARRAEREAKEEERRKAREEEQRKQEEAKKQEAERKKIEQEQAQKEFEMKKNSFDQGVCYSVFYYLTDIYKSKRYDTEIRGTTIIKYDDDYLEYKKLLDLFSDKKKGFDDVNKLRGKYGSAPLTDNQFFDLTTDLNPNPWDETTRIGDSHKICTSIASDIQKAKAESSGW